MLLVPAGEPFAVIVKLGNGRLFFGTKSEKLDTILDHLERKAADALSAEESGEPKEAGGADSAPPAPSPEESPAEGAAEKKRKGHGRNPADAYVGAEQIDIPTRP